MVLKDPTTEKNNLETVRPVTRTLPPQTGGQTQLKPAQDTGLLDRLKRSGLDPQKLLDLALAGKSRKATIKQRHRLILLGYIFFVGLPSLIFAAYMLFWASDQYHSTTAFAVRSSNMSAATEVLGMVLSGGSESTTSNSYIVNDYLQSQAVLEDLSEEIDLQAIFNRNDADWLFQMGRDLPIEDQLAYWNRMVSISFDGTSGVIYVEVRTFAPQDSVTVANAILRRSEILVNQLSEANRRQGVRFAEETAARAEAGLKAIRRQMLAFRDLTQEVSPEDNARMATEMIAALEARVATKETEKKTLETYLDQNSPRVRLMNQEIRVLNSQIVEARQKLGTGNNGGAEKTSNRDRISLRISDYSDLKLEEEFANRFYTTALAGLEKARQDADQNTMYLATFIEPTLSQQAQYPHRLLYSFSVFLLLAGLWTVLVLMYYNVRDRT
ncbi:hypothetical protein [Roseibium algae]|uniref:Capsular polysaccharide transport system permease protein n=1 Tax=Roseibium algae TaxID=3123038 RepID=A0ABU8TQ60_9HYPH